MSDTLIAEAALAAAVAWGAGLRLYAVTLVLGLPGRHAGFELPDTLQWLSHPLALGLSGLLALAEFVSDNIPLVDSASDTVQTFIRIPAGATLFGGGIAAGAHIAKAGSRAFINTSPEPVSNVAASFGEEALLGGGLWLAFAYAPAFLAALGVFLLAAAWLARQPWRWLRPPPPPAAYNAPMEQYRGTTILSVRRGAEVALGGDGQVTLGNIVIKASARKVRRLYQDKVLAGFAGGTADAFTLFERFEAKLDKHSGHLLRSAVELAKDWRTDRMLRRLEAMLAVANSEHSLIITGNGDVLEPEHGIAAIGSGGAYAQAAALALLQNTDLPPLEIVKKSLTIAGEICIYSNQNHVIEELRG